MIGTRIAANREKHQPFKYKLRYARAVTVCIGAICRESNQNRIVLCSDTRIDYGDLGSTNSTCKVHVAGWGWCIQLAGGWSGALHLASLVSSGIQSLKSAPSDVSKIARKVDESSKRFMRSPFFDPSENYQVLVSGFVLDVPHLLRLSIYSGRPELSSLEPFAAIGSGHEIANAILSLREYEGSLDLEYAAYLAYEAKRCSEKTGFVGKVTTLLVQSPANQESRNRASVNIMGETGRKNLEELYQHFWRVPFDKLVSVPELPLEFFIDPTKPQPPE